MAVSVFSPAKINLFLAVTGRRADGFHDLLSVAAPLDFGDELKAEGRSQTSEDRGQFTLECDHPEVPVDGSNLVLKAAASFANATGWREPVRFTLTKRIPMGAGLGGGSSNAVAALRALNRLSGDKLDAAGLERLAAGLGSDCVLFLRDAPVVMRGRGERVEPLPTGAAVRLRGRPVLLFKPGFGISTPWAYGRMIARGTDYLPAVAAEEQLAAWLGALPVLLERLRREFGVAVAMSGSGSTCYALVRDPPTGSGQAGPSDVVTRMKHRIRELWGPEIFVREARLA
jgi:4-diphosphocytidyl-2-C-methyl-D-erythritol kinase